MIFNVAARTDSAWGQDDVCDVSFRYLDADREPLDDMEWVNSFYLWKSPALEDLHATLPPEGPLVLTRRDGL